MDALTVNEAGAANRGAPRVVGDGGGGGRGVAPRAAAGDRRYGPGELQRLRTLRDLLERHEVGLAEVGFARRLRDHAELQAAVEEWLAAHPQRPDHVPADEWLGWEQSKHERLLAAPEPVLEAT